MKFIALPSYSAAFFLSFSLPVSAAMTAPPTVVSTVQEGIRVYPNPWRADQDANSMIMFDHLPEPSTVKIFTVSGHEVRTLSSDNGSVGWDRTNKAGDRVASGIYLYLITDSQGNPTKGKLAIIH